MINRELDGVYFRIKRDNELQNICFSDMTEDEMDKILKQKSKAWICSLAKILANRLREVGDIFDITCSCTTKGDSDE